MACLFELDAFCTWPGFPCVGAGAAAQPTVVLESVELPGWLFGGEVAAPEVAEAAALAAEEPQPGAQAPTVVLEQDAAAGTEQAAATAAVDEQQAEVDMEQAVSETAVEVDNVASPPPAALPEQPHEAASQRRQLSQLAVETAASEEEESDDEAEEEDYCQLCGKSGEPKRALRCGANYSSGCWCRLVIRPIACLFACTAVLLQAVTFSTAPELLSRHGA